MAQASMPYSCTAVQPRTAVGPYHRTVPPSTILVDSTTEHRTQAAGGHREAAEDGDDAVGGEYTMCPG
jgi:hypothetical protein